MIIYAVVEVDPYLPDHGYDEQVVSLYKNHDKASKQAEYLSETNQPFRYYVESMEVFE